MRATSCGPNSDMNWLGKGKMTVSLKSKADPYLIISSTEP